MIPIPQIIQEKAAASAVILAQESSTSYSIEGLADALQIANADVKLFGKPTTRPYRRMGVALAHDALQTPIEQVVEKAKKIAATIQISYH